MLLKLWPGAVIQARKTPTVLPAVMGTGTTLAVTSWPNAVRTTRTACGLVRPRTGHAVPGTDEASTTSGTSALKAMPPLPGTSDRDHAGHSTFWVAPWPGVRNVAQHTSAPRVAQATVVQCPGELLISVSLPFAGGSSATWASIGAALRAAAGPDWLGNILMVKPRVPAITLPAATKAASTAPNWVSLRRWRIRLPRPMIAAISRFGGCGSG